MPTAPPTPDRLVPRQIAIRQILATSPATEARRRKNDPAFPHPVRVGSGRLYYRMSDLSAYLAGLAS